MYLRPLVVTHLVQSILEQHTLVLAEPVTQFFRTAVRQAQDEVAHLVLALVHRPPGPVRDHIFTARAQGHVFRLEHTQLVIELFAVVTSGLQDLNAPQKLQTVQSEQLKLV